MSIAQRVYAIVMTNEIEYFLRTGDRFDVHRGKEWTRDFRIEGARAGVKGDCKEVFTARPDLQNGKGRKIAIMEDCILVSFEDGNWFFQQMNNMHFPDAETMFMALVEIEEKMIDEKFEEEDNYPEYDEYLHKANSMGSSYI